MIPALNRDGDVLSDLVLPLFGSIAGAESLLVAFDDDYVPDAVMAEAAHRTAPALQGKNVANPMAMILAAASLSATEPRRRSRRVARSASASEAVADGVRTADLGGHTATDEFTDDVIRRAKQKLEVWAALWGLGHGFRSARRRPTPRGRRERQPGRTGAGSLFELGQGAGDREWRPIRPGRDHRVERVGDGDDPGADRDLLPRAAGWISASVPPLVVEEDVGQGGAKRIDAADQPCAGKRVALDLVELVLVERARACGGRRRPGSACRCRAGERPA